MPDQKTPPRGKRTAGRKGEEGAPLSKEGPTAGPAKEARTSKVPPATQRRILRFLNAAKRPEDLITGPEHGVIVHPEGGRRRHPDVHEQVAQERKRKPLMDLTLAKRILEWRERRSPVIGFRRIEQLLGIEGIRDFLDRLPEVFGPQNSGTWELVNIPDGYLVPIHAALLRPTGTPPRSRVLFIPAGVDTYLWDPEDTDPATAFSSPSNQPVNREGDTDSLFCTGHAFLSDGKLLCAGGGGDGTGPIHKHGWKFDPDSLGWEQTADDMDFVRWYPTLVQLGDEPGRVLVVSGRPDEIEIYLEDSDAFERVWGPGGVDDTSVNRAHSQLYPGLHVLPGGQVFYTPVGWYSGGSAAVDYPAALPSELLEISTTIPPVTGSWTPVGAVGASALDALDRVKGMAVLLLQTNPPCVQVLVVGGGQDPVSTTSYQLIDLSSPTPVWESPMSLPDDLARVNVNLVLLPDSTVFLAGGRPLEGTPPTGGQCWIYDPGATPPAWFPVEEVSYARRYHSVAMLLPSGKVMVAGWTNKSIEIFSPPYLFKGPPPEITSVPDLVHHGQAFAIETPDPQSIDKVVLVRPMAVTHQTDTEQRVIELVFSASGPTTLAATMPDGIHPHALAPRGYYMLFILDGSGVPSTARFVYLH